MSRKWAVAGLLSVVILLSVQGQAAAFRSEFDPRWDCGLNVHVLVENNDFWTTNTVSDIYVVLTLMDLGIITEFQNALITIGVITEEVTVGSISIASPWDELGEKLHVVGHFNITPDQVNNAGWDAYVAHFYVQLNFTVRLDDGKVHELYTNKYVYVVTISTFSFIVLWPFPPIFLMMAIYWVGYLGLRKFNRRYAGIPKPSY